MALIIFLLFFCSTLSLPVTRNDGSMTIPIPTSLKEMTSKLTVCKQEAVYFSNNKASGFYRVESGFIGLYQVAETGKESLLRLYGKGSYFGYRSLFTHQRYPATARAMENSVVSRVNIHTFEDLQQLAPSLTKALTTEVCQELGKLSDVLFNLVLSTLKTE
ncbi:cyclic nucleotide-binding domain-containing protein [Vibrio artabrorum]|uniref:Cyclic nucleotide-binding domain-containing protein n=1 Tax=Vibrio artabrorum TaxID=446374 RepID=A0ABT8CPE0_9VIBR|nr:cyclic nucleotide-binding domain-containing protein [Vibrio artabrorum]MDN3702314.1 cyclic nucleotide-binding domain-containing protein [Vibrio artabrorum]